MEQTTIDYEKWKFEMKKELDRLVTVHFEHLYHAKRDEYDKIWREISGELYQKYNLVSISLTDPDYNTKSKMQHCIFINKRIYAEKIFPWELFNSRTYRFVKKYGKLPDQAPEEWNKFELDDRIKKGEIRRKKDQEFLDILEKYAATHS